jgi:GDP-D-mannose 3', 5'-epimerase
MSTSKAQFTNFRRAMTLTINKTDGMLIAGGGGFIGGWLVRSLHNQGFTNVRVVDIKPLDRWYQTFADYDNQVMDLQDANACKVAVQGMKYIYNMAADMGGMGFIELHKAECMLSVLINTNLLQAAKAEGTERFFYASSACVYAADKQETPDVPALKESDAYPAMPEDGYGWEKLFSERMVRHFQEDYGIQGRIARYHNVYGPEGTWQGGREKAPAALSRKVALAVLTGDHTIDIWGDGEQTRSFTYISDAIYGSELLFASDFDQPINIGSEEMVTLNQVVDSLEQIAGIKLTRKYDHTAPQGVRGRNSDNTLIRQELGWAPSVSLLSGLEQTYRWVYDQVLAHA